MKRDLKQLFNPQSIAVIGASITPDKVGAIVFRNIIVSGFKGRLYPVNPKSEFLGKIKCYPTVDQLPEVVDLAVIAIPAAVAMGVLEEIGIKGIKNVVIFSAGFKEIGEDGKLLENELIKICQKYEINLIGPNCLGFANNTLPVNITFSKPVTKSGQLRFISQSGALASSLFDWFETIDLGFSDFVTLGNKAVLNENDILEYWLESEESDVLRPIGIYLESISNGQALVQLAKRISKHDPIILLKPGRSEAGAVAMKSHTGSIAGEDKVMETAAKEAGIIRCDELEDFFDLSRAFAWTKAPNGPRIAIISNAGGPAVLTTDAITKEGLELAKFDTETTKKLAECLPRTASFLNPVDILGDALADRFKQATEIVLQEDTVDAVLVILTPQLMTQIKQTAEMIGSLTKQFDKALFCSFVGGGYTAEGENILNKFKIPTFRFPERAVKTLAEMYRWQKWKSEMLKHPPTEKEKNEKNYEGIDWQNPETLMKAGSINIPESKQIKSVDEAKIFAEGNGWPVVMKVASPQILHKTEVGGVISDIDSEEKLVTAWEKLQIIIDKLKPTVEGEIGVQIQQEIRGGVEVIVGIKRDATFGPVLQIGAGGKLAELIMDRNLHLLPITKAETVELITQSKVYKLLNGFRGGAVYNLDELVDLIQKLSDLVATFPQITDIEINPVLVTPNKVWALDPKVIIKNEKIL